MNFQFTNPLWLLALPPALAWVFWLAWKSDAAATSWRKWIAFAIRTLVLLAVVLALAGLQWRRPKEGMNVMFLLDRSDSIPPAQQESAREWTTASCPPRSGSTSAAETTSGCRSCGGVCASS